MNYRNDNATPLDRIDENFFRRMLNDEGYEIGITGRMSNEIDYPGYRGLRDSSCSNNDYSGSVPTMSCGCSNISRESSNCGCMRRQPSCKCRECNREENKYEMNKSIRASGRRTNLCSDNISSCKCSESSDNGFTVPKLDGAPLAMVYSPYQEWKNIYEPDVGLDRGTIFMDIDFPFYPTPCSNDGCLKCRN